MKRAQRHKHFQISMFFLIYSILNVVSTNKSTIVNDNLGDKKNDAVNTTVKTINETTTTQISKEQTTHGTTQATTTKPTLTPKTESTTTHSTTTSTTDLVMVPPLNNPGIKEEATKEIHLNSTKNRKLAAGIAAGGVVGAAVETTKHISKNKKEPSNIKSKAGVLEVKNETFGNKSECTPAAIKQFPRPLMGQSARAHGGLIIHIIVAVYMFLGLAIVCDEYFVASLDRICEELKMSPDVAGATFMAAGSSAPELATVIIGVFFAKDDIGISGVIGSAVFNIMFVISCCGLCSAAVVYLNWWPLIRDCFFYAVSIIVMLIVIYDKEISWVESVVMLITYLIYCVVLHFNTPLERWAQTWPVPFKVKPPTEESGLVSYKTLEETGKHQNYGMDWSPERQQQPFDQSMNNFGMEWSPEKHQESFANQLSGPALNQATTDITPTAPSTAAPSNRPNQQDYYKPKEYDPAAHVNPLIKPEGGSYWAIAVWGAVYPIHWFCMKTMPDCRTEKYRNWYPFTFFVSMIWISFYSYFMVWMITIIGYTMGIPDTVMGLTFVAAGVSVPDALSSIAVIKEGYGDMAVSNAVGSNVFDILICLGLPWFLKTAIVKPGSKVRVISKGLTYSTLSLLSTVVFLVVATHLNGWKLDRRYGVILMVWYLIFITFASMYELNLFGPLNPPVCDILDGW